MKTAIVTFVRAYNYGAVLQCYALSKKMNDLGIDTEVLDYFPPYFRSYYNLGYLGKLRYFPYRPLKNWISFVPVLHTINKRNRKFDEFIRKNIPMSGEQFTSYEDLCKASLDYEAYIVGSDQVWNDKCAEFDRAFFLDFPAAEQKKKYSYAASFGFSSLPDGLEKEYRKRLSGWQGYSSREASGIEILKKVMNVDATQCCDPTLLLSKNDWESIREYNVAKKPFIFVYTMNGSRPLLEYAQKLSAEKDLDIIYTTSMMHHDQLMGQTARKYGCRACGATSPAKWIGLFAEAEYVLTDSFHGTVFSMLFHKQFVAHTQFARYSNSRAYELMKTTHLEGRELSAVECVDEQIAWDCVDEILSEMREKSTNYLIRNLTKSEEPRWH